MPDAKATEDTAVKRNPLADDRSVWDAVLTFIPLGIAAFAIRVAIAPWVGHPTDMGTFIAWGRSLADVGFAGFYSANPESDYLPGYLYVLWVFGKISAMLPAHAHYLIFKLPNLIADVLTAWLVWRVAKPTRSSPKLIWPTLYLLNPVIIFNSAYWGQADSFHALAVLAGLTLCRNRRFVLSALMLGFACTIKPHSLVAVPLVVAWALLQGVSIIRTIGCVAVAMGVFVAAFAPFVSDASSGLTSLVFDRVQTTLGVYPYATVNAVNIWYVLGLNWISDATLLAGIVSVRTLAAVLVVIGFAFAIGWLVRRREAADREFWRVAAAMFLITFLFATRVHERHVYPALALLLCAAASNKNALWAYALLSFTCFFNMAFAWQYIQTPARSAVLHSNWVTGGLCVLSFGAFVLIFSKMRKDKAVDQQPVPRAANLIRTLAKRPLLGRRLALAGIVMFAFGTRVARLDQPPALVFDEVYHAYTAEQWAIGNTDAWRWDTKSSDAGCSYEWTHPPLAKLLMTGSILVFGDSAFAWRLPAALFGTLCVYLVYAIGRKLFANANVGLLAACFMAFDTLPLVLSRIAMNDIYCVAFVLLAVLACLHRRYFLSALFVGCAIACKWTGLFALPLLFVIRFHQYDRSMRTSFKSGLQFAAQVALVAAVYVGSYAPFFRAGNDSADFVELQRQMWGYHTRGDLAHDGASKALHWPLGRGTLYLFTESVDNAGDSAPSTTANIYAMGNPIIWWAGLGAIAFCIFEVRTTVRVPLVIAIFGFLVFWAPWIASPRIMFIYHYLPALPFLYLLLAWSLVSTEGDGRFVQLIVSLAGLALAVAFPYVTGIPLPMP
ncbi:MAG: phospholipid carrier-dependent glycosyltransferase [Planctomycetes bacterium]|nr:phospholipid carrier-dependent glycosyltransferase [Planctomycetota bacterium]